MAAIGSLTIHGFRGTVQGEQKPVEIVTRAGVAGTGMLVGAYTATPFDVETDYYSDISGCGTWRDTALGYVGTSQSVTDGVGATWTDVAIVGVRFVIFAASGLPDSATHIIRASWSMAAEV